MTEWRVNLGRSNCALELVKKWEPQWIHGGGTGSYDVWIMLVSARLANPSNKICCRGAEPGLCDADIQTLARAFCNVGGE